MNKSPRSLKLNRQHRVRRKLSGHKDTPRLTVYRSNQYTYAQIIDDRQGRTLVSVSETILKNNKGTKIEKATRVGQEIAAKAKESGIKAVRFDRGPYKYHGRVKAVAEAVRKEGLKV